MNFNTGQRFLFETIFFVPAKTRPLTRSLLNRFMDDMGDIFTKEFLKTSPGPSNGAHKQRVAA
jgi:hypothetical protein